MDPNIKPLPPQDDLDLSLITYLISSTPGTCPKCSVLKTPETLQGVWLLKHPSPYVKPLCKFCFTELTEVPSVQKSTLEIDIPNPVIALLWELVRVSKLFGIHHIETLDIPDFRWARIVLIPLLADEDMKKLWDDFQWINYGDVETETGKPEWGPIVYTRIEFQVNKEKAPYIPPRKPYNGEVEDVDLAHEAAALVSADCNHDPNLQLNVDSVSNNRISFKAVYNRSPKDDEESPGKAKLDPTIGSIEVTLDMHWRE